jgi:hypothetical protein
MRICFLLSILAVLIFACSQEPGIVRKEGFRGKKIIKEALVIAENYAIDQLEDPGKRIVNEGTVIIEDNQRRFVIEQNNIFTGLIDTDRHTDAIVTLENYRGAWQSVTEHLLLIRKGNELVLTSVIESDMKILGIKNGAITAEVPTHPRNSPLFDCPSCREVINYQFREGALIKMD